MEIIRKCYKCGNSKSLLDFPKNGITATGKQVYKYKCKECDAKRLKERQLTKPKRERQPRREPISTWFWKLKKTFSCEDCKMSFEHEPYLCDFHHLDPSTKLYNVGHMYKFCSREVILEEISKCTPLCSNCHRRRHYIQKIGA